MTKTMLITGASRGIGLALVEHAVADGWVVIAGARAPQSAERLNQLASLTGRIDVVHIDVSRDSGMASLKHKTGGARPIDLVVANAGVFRGRGDLNGDDLSDDAWREGLMANVFGVFATARAVEANLKAATGKLAAIASAMGSRGSIPTFGSHCYMSPTKCRNLENH